MTKGTTALAVRRKGLGPQDACRLTALETYAEFRLPDGSGRRVYWGDVEQAPGIYAAWLLDRQALRQCGLSGPAPVPLYVGKAIAKRGLADRIADHVHIPTLELMELLALQGQVLSPFAARRPPRPEEGYRPDTEDAMTNLGTRQALAWQHENVYWSWLAYPREEVADRELAAIKSLGPVLNFSGMPPYPPPQMRRAAPNAGRGQWLWHMSWAGLLMGNGAGGLSKADQERWKLDDPDAIYHADKLGYPVPPIDGGVAGAGVSRCGRPEREALWTLFLEAAADAPAVVRHAAGRGMKADELQMWWAAHAGAPLLPDPVSVRDAMAASLQMTPAHGRPGPRRLPLLQRCEELARIATRLTRFRH